MLIYNKSLTYCSNIFKEKHFYNLLDKLFDCFSFIKSNFKNKHIGLGLCFSNKLINTVLITKNFNYFNKWIYKNNFYLSSINGFVYKSFHKKKIKEYIYYPDWTTLLRLNFTKKIILLLSKLNNSNNNYSISTSPISFKYWTKKRDRKYIFFTSAKNFINIFNYLIYINNYTKKYIHLDIEPEPACLIETFDDFLYFFLKWLAVYLKFHFSTKYDKKFINLLKHYINLCYDICHFSVNFCNHSNIITLIKKHKIKIGKVQISSALELKKTLSEYNIKNDLLFLYNSQFLHQNTLLYNNILKKNIDIKYLTNYIDNTVRIHCHMPIYLNEYKTIFKTTSCETKNALLIILKNFNIKHLEIETYTYDMLLDINKFTSILKEYVFIINLIKDFKNDKLHAYHK